MNRLRLLAFLAALPAAAAPAPSAQAAEELTVAEYLKIKNGEVRVAYSFVPTYLDGVREGLLAFDELAESVGFNLLCIPEGERPIQRADFRKRIDEVIDEASRIRPDFAAYAEEASMGVVGLFVMNQAYPCKRQDSQAQNDKAAN